MSGSSVFDPIFASVDSQVYRYFDGEAWVLGKNSELITINSPIDASSIGQIPNLGAEEIETVMSRLSQAKAIWQNTPLYERIKMMHLAADWIRHEEHYLTSLLVREIGKTYTEAKSEIIRTADLVDYFAQEVQSVKGETLESDQFPGFTKGKIALVERAPYGVVLAISPFNYPVNLSASKIVPALLTGNCVLFKPPTQGAISALHLVRLLEKSGLPRGVLGVVTGRGSEIGDFVVGNQQIDLVAFTGSSETGKTIAAAAAMKPLLFECGGNNAAIVMPDADMQLTAREIVKGAFAYAGQRCTAIKYVLTTPAVASVLLPRVLQATGELVHAGDPRSPETKLVGPVISEKVAGEIEEVIHETLHQGGRLIIGGKRQGTLVEATIFTGVTPNMTIVKREIFGPVLSFIHVVSWAEAANIINLSRFGLQAAVFTRDEGAGIAFAQTLNVGSVQINGSPQRGPDHFPFLGVRDSGVGVQGVRYSLEAMSRLKPVIINKPG